MSGSTELMGHDVLNDRADCVAARGTENKRDWQITCNHGTIVDHDVDRGTGSGRCGLRG